MASEEIDPRPHKYLPSVEFLKVYGQKTYKRPRVLVQYKMQTVTIRIWTHFTVSITNKSKHYTNDFNYFYLTLSFYTIIMIRLFTVIWFHVFLSNTNNFQTDLFNSLMGLKQVLPFQVKVDLINLVSLFKILILLLNAIYLKFFCYVII